MPPASGCYALCTFEGDILYVGLTANLNRRFFDHRETTEKRGETTRGRAFWFYYVECPETELAMIERSWINEHVELHGKRPILNKVDSPVR